MSTVRRLGLGLAALGRPAYINLGREGALPAARTVPAMRTACREVLDAAYAAGIRWVDTARSYGLAEEFLSGWLADRGHRDVTVSSKWGYAYVGGWRRDAEVHEEKEHTAARLAGQLAESRRLLGDRLGLYQVHSLTHDSPLFGDDELLAELAEAAAGGLRLGFSTTGPRQADTIDRALDLRAGGRRLFSAVQTTWNPLETSAEPALRRAREQGVTVLVKEVLANGRLAVDPPARVTRLAERRASTPDAVAIAAALRQPWADRVLLGAASPAQLRANLAATTLDLDPDELRELAGAAVPPAEYWSTRAGLAWT